MWTRITKRRILNEFRLLAVVGSIIAISCLVVHSDASIAMESNVDIELSRYVNHSDTPATNPSQVTSSTNGNAESDQSLNFAESKTRVHHQSLKEQSANTVPVYRSAPKQIDSPVGLNPSSGGRLQKSPGAQPLFEMDRSKQQLQLSIQNRQEYQQEAGELNDLNHAAAGHYKKHKQKKIRPKKKKMKKVKFMKKKKKVFVVVKKKKISKPVYHVRQHKRPKYVVKKKHVKEYHHHSPPLHHFSSSPQLGKYYDYREVPDKASWKLGFRRGNDKHLIERNDYKHKSHFKSQTTTNREQLNIQDCNIVSNKSTMAFRSQFRDKQEWLKSTAGSLDLNTQSDEAVKQYDATITQLCGWYEDDSIGGLNGTLERMIAADPEFVLGRALALELNLMGGLTAPRLQKSLANELEEFNKLVESRREKSLVTEHELLHSEVVNYWAVGELKKAGQTLERIVTLHPQDITALRMLQDTYFMLGYSRPMQNSLASSMKQLDESSNPLKGYAHGMFAFALEESNMYPQAQKEALKALSLIPRDTWAIHNYAHCLEMQAQTSEGLKWMSDRKCDWEPCQALACHQFWHTALFNINEGNFDQALALLDEEVLTRCASGCSSLDLHDGASLIYRMELIDLFAEGKASAALDNSKRWSGVYDICKPHQADHLLGFNDVHFMMSYLGLNDLKTARELIESIDEVPSLNVGQSVVKPLLEAMYQFKVGAYDKCVDLMEPIRFDIIQIGGSHAQRDVFEQLLLVAGLKSDKSYHNQLAQRLLAERETFHGKRTIQTELLAKAR